MVCLDFPPSSTSLPLTQQPPRPSDHNSALPASSLQPRDISHRRSLLHDTGTTDEHQSSTRLSFEFSGGFWPSSSSSPITRRFRKPRRYVRPSFVRHQELGDKGNVSTLTPVIQFATVLDNAGLHAELIAKETIQNVVAAFPQNGWTGCFSAVMRKKLSLIHI